MTEAEAATRFGSDRPARDHLNDAAFVAAMKQLPTLPALTTFDPLLLKGIDPGGLACATG